VAVGDRVVVEVGAVAHGGHCVARHEGQVLFVRHALPGETVAARVTSLGRKGRFVRADAVEVLVASPDRREAPCPVAPACGGCDWQHVTPQAQRRLKEDVVREAMTRFAGITLPDTFCVDAVVDPHPLGDAPVAEGLGWRTRGTLGVDGTGRAGFLAHRSHRVVVGGQCAQLHPRLAPLRLFDRSWPQGRVGFVAPSLGEPLAFTESAAPEGVIHERADGGTWSVAPDGFWQVHPGAPDALVGHVRRMLDPQAGERLVDLYAGVGLLGLSLARGASGVREVTLVEGDRRACELAAGNAGDLPATVVRSGVDRWVARPGALEGVDLVVLDPPRTGAGSTVVEAIASARPRAVAYVACDPVALARDLATFGDRGLVLEELVALDLFPTTHHVECVAKLVPR
jgi:tRNA/tmRNA/rRNA uracil-C5-methylase (TrmA/RlmC/RlmD family)